MSPPPPPLYLGPTFSVRMEPTRWGAPLLSLRPVGSHEIRSPRATTALFLPPERLVSIELHRLDATWSALTFIGELSRVARPSPVVLDPVLTTDATAILTILSRQLELPRVPREIALDEVPGQPWNSFVEVTGPYEVGHLESTNFGPAALRFPETETAPPASGSWLRVVGFTNPGYRSTPDVPPPVGYSGPSIDVVAWDLA